MGADIYLESENNACQAAWKPKFDRAVAIRDALPRGSKAEKLAQELVDEAYAGMYEKGYFRDCYNSFGFFAQTELSCWRDIVPMLDDGYMPLDKAATMIEMVEKATITLQPEVKKSKNKPQGGWKAYYENDRLYLISLLQRSIALGEPLRMSL